jgi:FkbM family methyltransferase
MTKLNIEQLKLLWKTILQGDQISEIKVVDVGAAPMPGVVPDYLALGIPGGVNLTVIGFDPDLTQISTYPGVATQMIPAFVGDGTLRTFWECQDPRTSSLYEPDNAFLQQWLGWTLPIVNKRAVQTVRLDDINEASGASFLKIDVQGAELDVLKGSRNILSKCAVVEVEAEFVEIYKGQPTFSQLDQWLNRSGFMLHRFAHIYSAPLWGRYVRGLTDLGISDGSIRWQERDFHGKIERGGQVLWSEAAVYVPNPRFLGSEDKSRCILAANIMSLVYGCNLSAAKYLEQADLFDKKSRSKIFVSSMRDYVLCE